MVGGEETEPKVVYHYTDVDTMMKIVEARTVWATCIDYLNDTQERTHYISQIRRRLLTHHIPPRKPGYPWPRDESAVFQDLIGAEDEETSEEIELSHFVTSFSALDDSLPQWRSYCPRGNGVAIGFKVNCFRNAKLGMPDLINPLQAPEPEEVESEDSEPLTEDDELLNQPLDIEPAITSGWINYVDGEPPENSEFGTVEFSPEVAKALDRDIEAAVKEAIEEEESNWQAEDGYSPSAASVFKFIIEDNASFRKHKSFQNEREYRLLVKGRYWIERYCRFRAKGSSLYPYIRVIFPPEAGNFIKRVVVGPTPNMRLSMAAIKGFFTKYGEPNLTVVESQVPFRDW